MKTILLIIALFSFPVLAMEKDDPMELEVVPAQEKPLNTDILDQINKALDEQEPMLLDLEESVEQLIAKQKALEQKINALESK